MEIKFKTILFDFDGVIIDSMPIRDLGFKSIFSEFDEELVKQLLDFHNENGGLSRYVKIRYFYEVILQRKITDKQVNELAQKFASIMKNELTNKKLLIEDTLNFIMENYRKFTFHIVSGSDHEELNFLCDKLDLKNYFVDIKGSPTPKGELVRSILKDYKLNHDEVLLIGDSINDYEAASKNNISFYGYNNLNLKPVSNYYIDSFKKLNLG